LTLIKPLYSINDRNNETLLLIPEGF